LITQLKSAKVSAKDILNASDKVVGMLKNKLEDVYSVYAEYENFLKQNGLEDQNSLLSYLPQVIDESAEIKDCDVYIVGFESFTAQIRSAILSLMKNARSVTAILLEGENNYAFVNETANFIRSAGKEQGQVINEIKIESNYQDEAKIISSTLFNPNENLIK
jgi:ATP-dependent helicase/nuclease subunit B